MRIFVIDDDPLSNYLTENLLRLEGFSTLVSTFDSAEQALAALLQHGLAEVPAVIFLDLNMPVMNGWQFLDALNPYLTELRGRCHIYILTSSLALHDVEKATTYELVSGFIHKPLDSAEIQAVRAQVQLSASP